MSRKNVSGVLKQEIYSARANLDLVLQTIAAKRLTSPLNSDDDSELKISEDLLSDGAEHSPKKRFASQSGKKRRRPNDQPNPRSSVNPTCGSYIVKLFDRSVDMAGFPDQASLYSMCRSWMLNAAGEQWIERVVPNVDEVMVMDVFPSPITLSPQEDLKTLRIPEPIQRDEEAFAEEIAEDGPNSQLLLSRHQVHWKKVRESWKMASKQYESRYARGLSLIRDMYDNASK